MFFFGFCVCVCFCSMVFEGFALKVFACFFSICFLSVFVNGLGKPRKTTRNTDLRVALLRKLKLLWEGFQSRGGS